MKIYTSYFNSPKLKEIKSQQNIIEIAITAFTPKWWKGLVYKAVAPPIDLVLYFKNNKDTPKQQKEFLYTRWYTQETLSKLSADKVLSDIQDMSTDKDIVVLLCHEISTDFCHRHLLCNWLNENNIECIEL